MLTMAETVTKVPRLWTTQAGWPSRSTRLTAAATAQSPTGVRCFTVRDTIVQHPAGERSRRHRAAPNLLSHLMTLKPRTGTPRATLWEYG
jgi:hypothetical protein